MAAAQVDSQVLGRAIGHTQGIGNIRACFIQLGALGFKPGNRLFVLRRVIARQVLGNGPRSEIAREQTDKHLLGRLVLGDLFGRFEGGVGARDLFVEVVQSGQLLGIGQGALRPHGHDSKVLHRPGAFKDPGQRVIVGRGNRIELMVVASRTAQSQSHECAANGVDLLVDDVHFHFDRVVLGQHLGTENEKTGSHQPLEVRGVVGRRQQIAGQLLADEVVVWQIAIKSRHHVVAIAPGMSHRHVLVHAVRVGITGDIEPPPPPAFTIAGRS